MTRKMKDSGVNWIGKIPEHWEVGKVKHCFIRKNEKSQDENPIVLSLARAGVKIRDISKNEGQLAESYYNYNPVEKGDLLLNPMDLVSGANCSISDVCGVISPAYMNLKAMNGNNPRFYDLYFKTQYWCMALFAHGKGVSKVNRWTLNAETLFNYYIPIPPIEEQQKIADYLDKKVSDIDLGIEKTRVSIEGYKDYKKAIITEKIMKGLNPDVKMKDSGIDWIGKIPEHWEVGKVKHCFIRKNEKSQDENPIVLSLARAGVKIRDISKNEGQLAESYYNYNPVEKGDLLLNPMDLVSGANCSISDVCGVISPAYMNLKAMNGNNPRFYDLYFKTQYWCMALFAHGKGVSKVNRWTLNAETLFNYYIPIPPVEEQQKIADYLDKKISEIDFLIEKKESLINELEEYKRSIIYEYVTGKKEII